MSNRHQNGSNPRTPDRKLLTIETAMLVLMFAMIFVVLNIGNVFQWWYSDMSETNLPVREGTWGLHRSQAGRYEILFPSESETWKTSFESEDFRKMKVFHVTSQDEPNNMMYGVAYNDYPRKLTDEEVKRELNHAKTLPGVDAKVLKVKELKIEGYPAYEVTTKIGPIYQISRYCIVENRRLYSIQVGSQNIPNNIEKNVDVFFDSFKILSR
ncbi:MAG: hypothetical protein P8M30_08445 [Planctomycetaceae bacterium]|nr:hypothetical protein [Planctomycetaceae bacterium]